MFYKNDNIKFYLKCCAKCALFWHFEYDILYKIGENKLYRNLIVLNNDKLYCEWGIAFHKTTSIVWRIGLKIIDVTYY